MLLSIFKISGHSMEPSLRDKTLVLVSSIPYLYSTPKIGDVIVAQINDTLIIKRIKNIKKNKYLLEGDNRFDSLKIEPITIGKILGKLILRISK